MEAVEQNYTETLRQKRLSVKKEQKASTKVTKTKKSVSFPLFLFSIAVLKDTLDVIPFIGFVTTPIFWFVVFIWFANGGSGSGNDLGLRIFTKGGISFAVGMIPIIKLFPETSLFVLSIYRDKKTAAKKRRWDI